MKILIITFTSGVNPGTIMQALGVQTAMKSLWPAAQVDFLNFPDFKSGGISVRGKKDGIVNTIKQKSFAAYRFMKYIKLRKKHFHYSEKVDLFDYTEAQIAFIKEYDIAVIGSDTILEQAYSQGGMIGLNWMPLHIKKIYFAASASPANFEPTDELKKVANEALFIGLRDELTIKYFIDKLGIDKDRIIKQPDPSYFLDISNFKLSRRYAKRFTPEKKYALYNFNSNFTHRRALADLIREKGYVVVSTAYNPYADICIDTIDAFEWAGVFPLVDIVVTERFHDSVFALRNEKPVIAIDWEPSRFAKGGDSKTLLILEEYGLKDNHFNLCHSNQLTDISSALDKIESSFNIDKVRETNIKMRKKLNEIMAMIKQDRLRLADD